MGDHHQAVGAAAGSAGVVVPRHQGGDGLGQVAGERGPLGRGTEADLGVEGEGRQPLAGLVGPADQAGDLAHDPGGQGDQVACGQAVGDPVGVAGGLAQGAGGDDIGGRGRVQHPLGQAAPAALADLGHQPVLLEDAQVVVDLLAWQVDPLGQRRGRRRLGQAGQQAGPQRVKGHHGGGRVVDHLKVEHAGQSIIEQKICQELDRSRLGPRMLWRWTREV
jgi:hypothetical protein